jgi:hypothetical protein
VSNNSFTLHEKLKRQYIALEKTRAEIDVLFDHGYLKQRAKDRMYEALFLNSHVLFESFLEELFFGLLLENKLTSSQKDVVPKIKFRSYQIAKDVIGSGKIYLDWMPYNKTAERAEIFFRRGRPFTNLTDNEKETIAKCYALRNVIAHKSDHSKEKFKKNVINKTASLLPREKTPTGFLQKIFRITPQQTHFSNLIAQMSSITNKLSK